MRTVWELLAENWHSAAARATASPSPSTIRARRGTSRRVHAAVRQLDRGRGGAVQEVEYAGERTRCCGLGGMIQPVDPDLSRRIAERRAGGIRPRRWSPTAPAAAWRCVGVGGEAIHLARFSARPDWRSTGLADYPPPGRLLRHANRLRTKWALSTGCGLSGAE